MHAAIIPVTFHLTFTLSFQYCFSEKNSTLNIDYASNEYQNQSSVPVILLAHLVQRWVKRKRWRCYFPSDGGPIFAYQANNNDSQITSSGEYTLMKVMLPKSVGGLLHFSYCLRSPVFRPHLFWDRCSLFFFFFLNHCISFISLYCKRITLWKSTDSYIRLLGRYVFRRVTHQRL